MSTWIAVKPVAKALTPYVKRKLLGTDLDIDLSKVVGRAWESAARAVCAAAQPACEIGELDEMSVILGRALHTEGTARALVVSVMDTSRAFDWAEHPEAGAILDGIDPVTAPVDPRGLWDVFIAALRHEVVEAAATRGLFELSVVAGLEDIRTRSEGISAGVEQLLSAGKQKARQVKRDPPPYLASVGELLRSTPQLFDRDTELGELMGFASGGEGYRWVIGGPWAGKTSLAAHLTASLGPDTDWVAYFLVRRENDADAARFLLAVNDQLSYLLGENRPDPPDDQHAFRRLWERAAARASDTSRHLLLIVDGLDEDVSRGRNLPSVASLLPTLVGKHARVLVTSRPHPELPYDVGVDHPLRRIRPVIIDPSPHAAELKERAQQELHGLFVKRGSTDQPRKLAGKVLALLAAAQGPLSMADLAALVPSRLEKLDTVIGERISRVVQPVGLVESRRFSFAHETLRQASEDEFKRLERLDTTGERIVAWAQRWKAEGWPIETTPSYLLDSYPAMLATRKSAQLQSLIEDPAWIEAAVGRLGVDRAIQTLGLAPGGSLLAHLLKREAHHLRPPSPVSRSGYTTGQICLAALAASDAGLAERMRRRTQGLPPPQLETRWTTTRLSLEPPPVSRTHLDQPVRLEGGCVREAVHSGVQTRRSGPRKDVGATHRADCP